MKNVISEWEVQLACLFCHGPVKPFKQFLMLLVPSRKFLQIGLVKTAVTFTIQEQGIWNPPSTTGLVAKC
jgi:hypothetical protein